MIKDSFLLKSIINNETDKEATIIQILEAIGFLIDKTEDGYFLSDNATVSDAEFLEKGFLQYKSVR